MPRCELSIQLSSETTRCVRGESVRGEVTVESDGDLECNDLTIRCGWATHGKGSRDEVWQPEASLYRGRIEAGLPRRFPFEVEIPTAGPVAYAGHYVNVGWFLQARADVPWKIDPRAELEIQLEHPEGVDADWKDQFEDGRHDPPGPPEEPETPRPKSLFQKAFFAALAMGCLVVVGSFFFFLWTLFRGAFEAIALSVQALRQVIEGKEGWPETIPELLPLILLLIAVAAVGTFVSRIVMRKKRLGDVELALDPEVARPGDEVRVLLRGQPLRSLELLRAHLVLRAQESATRGSGTNKRTFRHPVHEETFEISGARSLAAGMPYQVDTSIRIPEEAPATFVASNNALHWTIEAKMDVARCPDWSGKAELVVAPA